ncbi:AraC family transcriptional regulator [Neobacillus kokaensis]|uniref:AraC family transcriptional regulator n=1 Tax=Neobacillus kokaensis TaxID=2759023 RepID=A0ABQ3N2M4_9BACI|nr:helix-turn-helix domain-containing protein [Neobacillus kokaensis]GHH97897.1 AraC family transcriptional regulator [Neobacillus kokaensis]
MLERIPLFYKYLFSYLLLLIIPILVIALFSYQHFVHILKEEIVLGQEQTLKQMRDTFDMKMKEMNTISYEISSNPELTPYHLKQNLYNAFAAKRLLNFTVANQFVQNVVLYIKDGEYIYSAESTYSIPLFTEKIYHYKNWTPSQFRHELDHLEHPVFRPSEEVESPYLKNNRALTYLVPLPPNGIKPYGAAIFIIDEATVKKLQQGVIEKGDGNTIILNEKGETLSTLYDGDYLKEPSFLSSIQGTQPGSQTVEIQNTPYILSSVKSNYTGWTFLTIMPESKLLEKVSQVKVRALSVLIVSIILGTIVIYFLMHINYRPLQKVLFFTTNHLGKAIKNVNDMLHALSIIHEKEQIIEKKWKNNQHVIKEYLLLELLQGQTLNLDKFYHSGEEVGLFFRNKRFFVLRFEIKNEDTGNESIISQWLNDELNSRFESHKVKLTDGILTYICALETEDPHLKEYLFFVHSSLWGLYKKNITVGAGRIYEDPNKIGKSYMEASTALDYKLIKGQNQVIFFEDVMLESHLLDYWYPKEEIETLHLLVSQGNTVKIIEMIRSIHREVEKNRPPLHIVRCICYDIINCIIKNACWKGQRYLTDVSYPDIEKLSKFDTLQDFELLVNDICTRLSNASEHQKPTSEKGLSEKAIAYIHNNYQDHQFSVEGMADALSVSQAYLKRYFKQQTGQTITDYLSYCRIEHAKKLLETSDISLKELVQEVGYHDVSSFIRKFKNEMKITPGEFRKMSLIKRKAE